MDPFYQEIAKLGLAGLVIVGLLIERARLHTRIEKLEGLITANQESRLGDLKTILTDVTKALADSTRVMENTADESKSSGENSRSLVEVVKALKEAIDRFMVRA